jgi:hypothetical protein
VDVGALTGCATIIGVEVVVSVLAGPVVSTDAPT